MYKPLILNFPPGTCLRMAFISKRLIVFGWSFSPGDKGLYLRCAKAWNKFLRPPWKWMVGRLVSFPFRMAQPGPFSGANCWFQGGGHMCFFKPEGSSKLLHLHFWFRIFPKTFCSKSLPSKSPASYTRLINMEVTWFMVKHGSFHRLICFFSKTLVSLQRTLLLNSYTLSFNLTLILQSPYFLTTPCLSNHTGSFCIPLYCIQTLPLVYACCESYIFLLSVFLQPLIWRFWGSEQLPNSYGNCVRRFRPLMPSQAVPMNMLKRSDKNTTVDNRIIYYKCDIWYIYIYMMYA